MNPVPPPLLPDDAALREFHAELDARGLSGGDGAMPTPAALAGALEARTRRVSSWPYPAVWRRSWRLLLGAWAALALAGFLVVNAVNPEMPLNWGWNTIQRFDVPGRPHGLAASGRWVAVVTEGGTVHGFDTRGEVGYPVDGVSALDVSASDRPDEFLVLTGEHAIGRIGPGRWVGLAAAGWLDPPASPVWPLAPGAAVPTPGDVLDCDVDPAGVLLAVRGLGVTRYRAAPDADGVVRRTRDWQCSDLSAVRAERAVVARDRVWLALSGGGLRLAARGDLGELERGRQATPAIRRLEAGHDRPWAAAVDAGGGAWLYPSADAGWAGPFFGGDPGRPRLASAGEVKLAELTDRVLWMSDGKHLFAYDRDARRIACVLQDVSSAVLLPVPGGARLLHAGGTGLHVVEREGPGRFRTAHLDRDPVRSASLSPGGNLCAYTAVTPGGDEVRLAVAPWSASAPRRVLVPASRWGPGQAPVVTGVVPAGRFVLVATTRGAFLYDPATRTYTDCTTARDGPGLLTLREFRGVWADGGRLLAVSDGLPLLMPVPRDAAGARWQVLDADSDRRVVRVLSVGDGVFGLGSRGELHRYPLTADRPKSWCEGTAPESERSPPGNDVPGDVLDRADGSWAVSFLHGDRLWSWDAATARTTERHRPWLGGVAPVQLRLTGTGSELLVLPDATVRNGDGASVFGGRGLPFSPERITAVAPGAGPGTVLLGGPDGHVVGYDSARGRVEPLGSVPGHQGEAVAELHAAGGRVYARLPKGGVAVRDAGDWTALDGCRAWAASPGGTQVWLAGPTAVVRTEEGKPPRWPGKPDEDARCFGAGMKPVLAAARFAWVPDGRRVVFLGPAKYVGIYDQRTNNFAETPWPRLTDPRAFGVDADNGLVVLNGREVLHVPAFGPDAPFDRRPRVLFTLPPDARGEALAVHGRRLQVAFARGGRLTLAVWDDLTRPDPPVVSGRGGPGSVSDAIDLKRVVLADVVGGRWLLADARGAAAVYDPAAGTLRTVRAAEAGQTPLGWLGRDGSAFRTLLLGTAGGRVVGAPVGTEGAIGRDVPLGPDPGPPPVRVAERERLLTAGRAIVPLLAGWADGLARAHAAGKAIGLRPAGEFTGDGARFAFAGGDTTFQHRVGTDWLDWHPGKGRFAEDEFTAAAFAPSGALWALQGDGRRLVRLVPDGDRLAYTPGAFQLPAEARRFDTAGGVLRAHPTDGPPRLLVELGRGELRESPDPTVSPLVRVAVGGWKLAFRPRHPVGIEVAWEAPAAGADVPPVWSDAGALAVQTTRDAAATPDGELLLVTDAGLVVRDAATFALKRFDPAWRAGSFVRAPGGKLGVAVGGRLAAEWQGGAFVLLPASAPPLRGSVAAGPWRWDVDTGPGAARLVGVVHTGDGTARAWDEGPPGEWRFRDDRARWLARSPAGGPLWLATGDGLWAFDPAAGRGAGRVLPGRAVRQVRCPEGKVWWWNDGEDWRPVTTDGTPATGPTPAVEIRSGNAAVAVEVADGRVRFRPADGAGRSAFRAGRFFFDAPTDAVAWKGGLHLLVPGRCVIRRAAASPAVPVACWPLPVEVPADAEVELTPAAARLRLLAVSPGGERRAWALDPLAAAPAWEAVAAPEPELLARAGPFGWRKPTPTATPEPFVVPGSVTGTDGGAAVRDWWANGRFAWDEVRAAGALADDRVALATAAGVLAVRVAGPAPTVEGFWPGVEAVSCATAREPAGAWAGLLLRGPDGAWHRLTTDPGGRPNLTPGNGPPPASHGTVSLTDGDPGIEFRQTWQPDPAPRAFIPALSAFPNGDALRDGQFVFDHADGAAELAGPDRAWLTFTRAPGPGGPVAHLVLNELSSDRVGGLRPRRVWVVPAAVVAVRGTTGPRPTAFVRDESGEVRAARLTAGPLVWEKATVADAAGEFRQGGAATLRLADLGWEHRPVFAGDPPAVRLSTEPAGRPVFARTDGGAAFGFDVFTSLALVIGERPRLAVGTRAGVAWLDPGRPLFSRFPGGEPTFTPLAGVSRVRPDQDGGVRVWVGGERAGRVRAADDGWEPSDVELWRLGRHEVRLTPDGGLVVDGIGYPRSRDAWGFGRRAITGLTDVWPDEPGGAVWACGPDGGLFKILPRLLK